MIRKDVFFNINKDLSIELKFKDILIADSVNYVHCYFIFKDEEKYKKSIKTAYFKNDKNSKGLSQILDNENHCIIPTNVLLEGYTSVGLGIVENDIIIYTSNCYVPIVKSSKIEVNNLPYTDDLYEQVMKKIEELGSVVPQEKVEEAVKDYFGKNPIKVLTEEEVETIANDAIDSYKNSLPDWVKQPNKPVYDASEIAFTDGQTFQQKFDSGQLKGEKGEQGVAGKSATISIGNVISGDVAKVTNTGTPVEAILDFVLPKGDAGINGQDGRGIVSIERTSGTGAAGTKDIYTITYTDGTQTQFSVYNGADGTSDTGTGGSSKRTVRFIIGTSASGWTKDDCDYLCDGIDDQVEINAAIQALPSTGGEIKVLDGTYNITASIVIDKERVTFSGIKKSTIFKRMRDGDSTSGVIVFSKNYCVFENFEIDGNKSAYKGSGLVLFTENITDTLVKDVTSNNNKNYGIALFYSLNGITSNCITKNNDNTGILLNLSKKGIMSECISRDNGISNASIMVAENVILIGNQLENGEGLASDYTSSQHTIMTNDKTKNCIIIGNNCSGKPPTISGTNNIVENNLV